MVTRGAGGGALLGYEIHFNDEDFVGDENCLAKRWKGILEKEREKGERIGRERDPWRTKSPCSRIDCGSWRNTAAEGERSSRVDSSSRLCVDSESILLHPLSLSLSTCITNTHTTFLSRGTVCARVPRLHLVAGLRARLSRDKGIALDRLVFTGNLGRRKSRELQVFHFPQKGKSSRAMRRSPPLSTSLDWNVDEFCD